MHDALHKFRGGRGTGTAVLEANLAQQLVVLAHAPLLQVFLDICKAYNSLYREQYLEVLSRYGIGLNLTRLLKYYWEQQRIVPNTGRLGPAQDIHFFYTRSHFSALQNDALIFSANFSLFSHLKIA